jgi:hypothetical protein
MDPRGDTDSDEDQNLHMNIDEYARISEQVAQHIGSVKNIGKEMSEKYSQLKRMSEHHQANLGENGELTEFEELKGQLRRDGWENLGREGVKNYLEDGERGEIEKVINRPGDRASFGGIGKKMPVEGEKFVPRQSLIEKGEKLITELRVAEAEGKVQTRSPSPSQPWLNKVPWEIQNASTRTVIRDSERGFRRARTYVAAKESRFKGQRSNGTTLSELSQENLTSCLENPETSIEPGLEKKMSVFEQELKKDIALNSKKYLELAKGRDINQMQKSIDDQISRLNANLTYKPTDVAPMHYDSTSNRVSEKTSPTRDSQETDRQRRLRKKRELFGQPSEENLRNGQPLAPDEADEDSQNSLAEKLEYSGGSSDLSGDDNDNKSVENNEKMPAKGKGNRPGQTKKIPKACNPASKSNLSVFKNKNVMRTADNYRGRRGSVIPDKNSFANTMKPVNRKDSILSKTRHKGNNSKSIAPSQYLNPQEMARKAKFQKSPYGELVKIDELLLEGKNKL